MKFILIILSLNTIGAEHEVTQKERKFSKDAITIKVGDTIKYKNADGFKHNIMSESNGYNINAVQEPGSETSIKYDKEGEVEMECAIHPQMKLKVKVEK
jgi:plastocyanin